jgi:phage terminase large subunit
MLDIFPSQVDLFVGIPDNSDVVEPWKPESLTIDQWPPDYKRVFAWRIKTLIALRGNPDMLASAKAYYKTHKAEFIMHWMDTYNPRKTGSKWMPFVFFERQLEFVQFIEELRVDQENGLVEKCRDIGATWLASAYSVSCYLLDDDEAIGWGSRKQELVDKLGDPDSIFEKMRLLLKRMPDIWTPEGFKARDHATFMKLLNPENGSSVTGESGDNIGRGGRKSIYWKDESAHYERPEKIEAALGDNTNVQIDISSVNGLGNVFHRRRESGIDWQPGKVIEPGQTRVFVFDWRHHPEKTQEWYDQRKAKAEREGMQHIFAQEVDRNYSAAVQNTIISYEWIQAAVDAHLKIPYLLRPPSDIPNVWVAGLDVADGGIDRNALALTQWIIVRSCEEWGARDQGISARHAMTICRPYKGIKIQYDNIGVGAGVKTEYNNIVDQLIKEANERNETFDFTSIPRLIGWNAGASVVNPYDRIIPDDDESLLNKDMFYNFKAQAWWNVRTRFYKTWRAITDGAIYDADELISLDSTNPLLLQLMKELAQPTRGEATGLRTIVNKKPEGTKSPNLADAVIQAMFPVQDEAGVAVVGAYSA